MRTMSWGDDYSYTLQYTANTELLHTLQTSILRCAEMTLLTFNQQGKDGKLQDTTWRKKTSALINIVYYILRINFASLQEMQWGRIHGKQLLIFGKNHRYIHTPTCTHAPTHTSLHTYKCHITVHVYDAVSKHVIVVIQICISWCGTYMHAFILPAINKSTYQL